MDENTGFAKKLDLSDNFQRFKAGYEKQVILRFGIYNEKPEKVKKGKDKKNFGLELLKKHKTVYDIQFINFSSLSEQSIEMEYIADDGKNIKT
jgi:hypothetical protein